MPGRDGTGPEGRGPGTGRGMGPCVRARGSGRRSDSLSARDPVTRTGGRWQDLLAEFCRVLIDKLASRGARRR
jgi:hypothetical protein